jgi:hypothetical protein
VHLVLSRWRNGTTKRRLPVGICRPQDLQFSRGKRGKPAVAGPQEALQGSHLHFSLSHTGGLLGAWAPVSSHQSSRWLHCANSACSLMVQVGKPT